MTRRSFATALLVLYLALSSVVTVYEDLSVQLFNTPGIGFCVPGGLCERE